MKIREEAEATLRRNDRGRHTVPSPDLYPHLWAWDSAFAAIGWAHLDPDRAIAELETLLAGAWPDGRIPHIAFDPSASGYWPDPSFWGTSHLSRPASSISQPPLWATAARRLVELGVDEGRLAPLLSAIEASHLWFAAARDPLGIGLVAVAHPWESGMDNAPAWDGPLEAVDPTEAPPFERRDTAHVDDPEERPTDDHYRRYAVIVRAIERDGFGPGPFAVYDPALSACLARAEVDLAWLSARLGRTSAAGARADGLTKALVAHLWDEGSARFAYLDARKYEKYLPHVIGAHLPAMLDLPAPILAATRGALRRSFDAPHPIPTTAPGDAAFDPRRYWRGPSWVNVNWLLLSAWGDDLPRRTLELVETGGMREYFDPRSGEGLGAGSFAWTAALALDLLARDR